MLIKLGSYLLLESDRPPHKGVHVCHILLFFPLEQQPWSSLLGWMRQAANPFPRGPWILCSGRILGVPQQMLGESRKGREKRLGKKDMATLASISVFALVRKDQAWGRSSLHTDQYGQPGVDVCATSYLPCEHAYHPPLHNRVAHASTASSLGR